MTRPGPIAATAPKVRPTWLLAILVGGAAGTALRSGLEAAFAQPDGWPWATFWLNISGSLALAALLEALAGGGSLTGWRRLLRLGLGTGFLGGYTTYSSFAVETVTRFESGAWQVGLGYAVGSVLLGLAAALTGAGLVRLVAKRVKGS